MTSKREGEHPARAYGATGEEDLEKFPEDEQLGSFARGQEKTDSPQNEEEGTFGTVEEQAEN